MKHTMKQFYKIITTAPCKTCKQELTYRYGWEHTKEGDYDHSALPKFDQIKRTEQEDP